VRPEDVWAEMDRRERVQGIAEKLPKVYADKPVQRVAADKPRPAAKATSEIAAAAPEKVARRPIVALQSGRLKKRR
ncbi:hypothetical protein, partial [Enterococcus faecium]|uniref:hypothetical protein n=1 Tax=Enterococcus faecium TaxID=1352 RepID=UPI003F524150